MKKLQIIACVIVVALFGFAATGFAGEASVFDPLQNWVLRAYTVNAGGSETVMLEVRDTSGIAVDVANVNGLPGNPPANPATVATGASSPNVSIAFNDVSNKTYVFYTDAVGVQVATYTLTAAGPVLSVSPNPLAFGNVTVNTSQDRNVTVTNTGTANLTFTNPPAVTGTGFSRLAGGCTDTQTLAPNASCNITVRFSPTAAAGYSGNLSFQSDGGNASVNLTGTGVNGGGGSADLVISSIVIPKSLDNGVNFNITITVQNSGSAAAGFFAVKAWIHDPNNPQVHPNDDLLLTWTVPSLGAGSSATQTFNVKFNGWPLHYSYNIFAKADADNAIAESNEANNIRYTIPFYVSR